MFLFTHHCPALIGTKGIEEEKKTEKKLNAAALSKIEFTMLWWFFTPAKHCSDQFHTDPK